MHKLLYIFLFAFATSAVSAQNLPERGEVRKGNRLFNKGEYEQSAERYKRALKAAPGQFEATYNLGNALYKAERFEHAEQTMLQSSADTLRADGERAEAFYNLGNAQFQQKKYKEALESYKQSLRLNPSDTEAKYNYAYTKRLLDQDKTDGGGGGDQDQDKDQNKDQDKDKQNPGEDQQGEGDPQTYKQDEHQGQQQGIPQQEQEQMLDAIQAQEDKTQDKLKDKQGVVVRGSKNW